MLRFAGTRARIAVEMKRRANAATAWQLAHYAQAHPEPPLLLIADETTLGARKILEDHRVAVIDGLGNAHLELPGLLVHLEGGRRPPRRVTKTAPARLSGKAGVVAQALLLRPERAWRVQDVAAEAKVSVGLAHRVVARLVGEGIMAAAGTGPNRVRRVTDPTALLDLWAEESVDRPIRYPGHFLAQTPKQLIEEVGAHLERGGITYALTRAAGASLVAPFVTAIPVVDIWVNATAAPDDFYERTRADRVGEGENVVFLQARDNAALAFRQTVNGLWVTNRFRLYADLRRDPRRGREQADHLRREVIGF